MSIWASGDAYEPYVGRWSRLVATEFVTWLAAPPGGSWLDVGCGTGALCATILTAARPSTVTGIDASNEYAAFASAHIRDDYADFCRGDAQALPFRDGSFDATASGLMLNFLSDPRRALLEMVRVTRPGGLVAVYVWDYAGQMQLMRHFWDAAAILDPASVELDEGRRFSLCRPEMLERLFTEAAMTDVAVRAIDVPTVFRDFDDYWSPFLGGQGPAPSYTMSLSEERRATLRERIRETLPVSRNGSIQLIARAWAACGRRNRS